MQLGKIKVFPIRAQVPNIHRKLEEIHRHFAQTLYVSMRFRALLAGGSVLGIRPFLHLCYKESNLRDGHLENIALHFFTPKHPSTLPFSTAHTCLQKPHLATHSPFPSKRWNWACLI